MIPIVKILVACILPLLSQPFSLVMAVDRTKFRTCSNTSFCRRNRNGRNQPMYSYRILPNSLMIHKNHDNHMKSEERKEKRSTDADFEKEAQEEEVGKLGGYYQKIKRFN